MKSIKKGGLSRRISIGLAGASGGIGLLKAKAGSMILPKEQQQAHNEKALDREAQKFVQRLGELKGAYVKIGQMLALYGEHILPTQVTNALHGLESSTTPLDWQAIEPVFSEELNQKLKDGLQDDARLKLQIDQAPIAAASLSQVHKGLLDGGEQVCVKIQYPGIDEAIEDDFKNVIQMLSIARWVKSGRQLETLATELKRYLMREVDYGYELEIAEKLSGFLDGDSRYKVPKYFPQLCSQKLLVMEYIDGYDVTHERVQNLSQTRRNALAESMLSLFFKEAFEWRYMQTDPNFGNYRILIDESGQNQDQLVLLDFGAVHELEKPFSRSLRKTILAAQAAELEAVVEGLIEIGCLEEADSDEVKQSFAEFCHYILEPFRESFEEVPDYALDGEDYNWRDSRLLKRAGKLGSQGALVKGFKIPPPEFMLMIRKLTGVFTFASTLGAKTSSANVLLAYRRK